MLRQDKMLCTGRTWGRKGQTPVVERPGQRQSISAASAVNARGGFWYCTYQGGLNAALFVTLLRKIGCGIAQNRCTWWSTGFPHTRQRW